MVGTHNIERGVKLQCGLPRGGGCREKPRAVAVEGVCSRNSVEIAGQLEAV